MRQERVIVVSPRKSGTHLVQKLMTALGYGIYGEPVPPESGRAAVSLRERLELAERFLHPDEFAALDVREDTKEFIRRTDRLLIQLGWIWQTRLAARNLSNVDLIRPEIDFELRMSEDAWTRPFWQTAPRLCWIFHSLDIWRMDQKFLNEWTTRQAPAMVLNHRDPRDALVSMANFFSGKSGITFRRFPESAVFGPILANLPDMESRITYMLTDPTIPLLHDYEAAVSWYHHPQVCKVAFEELAGPEGGGSRARQLAAVERVAGWAGTDADPEAVVGELFDRRSFTFHKGRIGAWREVFTARHSALFDARFGHLTDMFGYA
ncbi:MULTISPECIES: hypothetical protein [Nonomuraea]|uniref:Sulfotransferase domain-containing protein n=1 Tax=Nonomuraea salmonea TaxID=46181 RepID=A0ABV5NWL8_9ACTN